MQILYFAHFYLFSEFCYDNNLNISSTVKLFRISNLSYLIVAII